MVLGEKHGTNYLPYTNYNLLCYSRIGSMMEENVYGRNEK